MESSIKPKLAWWCTNNADVRFLPVKYNIAPSMLHHIQPRKTILDMSLFTQFDRLSALNAECNYRFTTYYWWHANRAKTAPYPMVATYISPVVNNRASCKQHVQTQTTAMSCHITLIIRLLT